MTSPKSQLASGLTKLAEAIEKHPPAIIGQDITVQVVPGASAVGKSISVTAGFGSGNVIGERIQVVGTRPGQEVIGMQITVGVGDGPSARPPSGARSQGEIDNIIRQLREAALAVEANVVPEQGVKSLLETIRQWGSDLLRPALEGATNALTTWLLSRTDGA